MDTECSIPWRVPLWCSHCSYLDIYISQNIRLCKGDFEGQFQTSLQARIMIFFIWKFIFIILIFFLFFARIVKSTAFCTLLLLFQRVEVLKLQFDTKTWLKQVNLFEIALTVSKKHWISQFLKKYKTNEYNRSEFSDQKIDRFGL